MLGILIARPANEATPPTAAMVVVPAERAAAGIVGQYHGHVAAKGGDHVPVNVLGSESQHRSRC